MTPLGEALEQILSDCPAPPAVETCPIEQALGRTLAEDVHAPLAVPSWDNSAMDGYALRAEDGGAPLRVAQSIAAGHSGAPLAPGTAARIFTGAPIPPGADAVIPQESCEVGARPEAQAEAQTVAQTYAQAETQPQPQSHAQTEIQTQANPHTDTRKSATRGAAPEQWLRLLAPVAAGDNIRRRGQDIQQGDRVLGAGRRLRGEDLGVLASLGCAAVPVYRPLVVAVLSTGDELVEPGAALGAGQLFNSNRYLLRGLLEGLGMVVRDGGIVADTPVATADALRRAAAGADCVISSGGVSVGGEDHVKAQVAALGELRLWRLRLKPGKPLAYGRVGGRVGSVPFFGLPGNPAAVFVTFALVVRPWLLRRQGADSDPPLPLPARAAFAIERPGTRHEFLRARVGRSAGQSMGQGAEQGAAGRGTGQGAKQCAGELWAELHPNQSSGVLSAVSWANALVSLPPATTVAPGDWVEVLLLDQLVR